MRYCAGSGADLGQEPSKGLRPSRRALWTVLGLLALAAAGICACSSPPDDGAATTVQATGIETRQPVLYDVWVGDKVGYIDSTGKLVIPAQFAQVCPFSEGLAAVQPEKDGLWGFIDTTGKMVIQPQFGWVDSDSTGDMATQREFPWVDQSFSGGLAGVLLEHKGVDKELWEGPYGFIDTTGKIVIRPKFYADTYPTFSEGLAPVRAERDGPWGYIDTTGKMVIPAQFDTALSFSEGLAGVAVDASMPNWSYIDRTGRIVIATEYESGGPCEGGVVGVFDIESGGYSLIDRSGKVMWQGTWPR